MKTKSNREKNCLPLICDSDLRFRYSYKMHCKKTLRIFIRCLYKLSHTIAEVIKRKKEEKKNWYTEMRKYEWWNYFWLVPKVYFIKTTYYVCSVNGIKMKKKKICFCCCCFWLYFKEGWHCFVLIYFALSCQLVFVMTHLTMDIFIFHHILNHCMKYLKLTVDMRWSYGLQRL